MACKTVGHSAKPSASFKSFSRLPITESSVEKYEPSRCQLCESDQKALGKQNLFLPNLYLVVPALVVYRFEHRGPGPATGGCLPDLYLLVQKSEKPVTY